jgi:hypothetical protein
MERCIILIERKLRMPQIYVKKPECPALKNGDEWFLISSPPLTGGDRGGWKK